MNKRKIEDLGDMSERLRQLEELLRPALVSPRAAADDQIPIHAPAPLATPVARRRGQMYVKGREPHFRPVTLLRSVREGDSEPS